MRQVGTKGVVATGQSIQSNLMTLVIQRWMATSSSDGMTPRRFGWTLVYVFKWLTAFVRSDQFPFVRLALKCPAFPKPNFV